jgi:hypothetical protein
VAESLLPGVAAPDGEIDDRWQAIIDVSFFIETDAEAVWEFIRRWGCHEDEDLRAAIATCLLEELLAQRFEVYFSQVEVAVRGHRRFADTFATCWKMGKPRSLAMRRDSIDSRRNVGDRPADKGSHLLAPHAHDPPLRRPS